MSSVWRNAYIFLFLSLLCAPTISWAQLHLFNAPHYVVSGSTIGYQKNDSALRIKNLLRHACNWYSALGPVADSLGLPWGANWHGALFFNNSDTSVIKKDEYLPVPYSVNYMMRKVSKSCVTCIGNNAQAPTLLQYANEFSTDSFLLSAPLNPALMGVP